MATETARTSPDPWSARKTIRLDRSLGKSVYVAVNGRAYQVPTGKAFDVPEPIYDKLVDMQMQVDVLDDVRVEMAKDTAENSKFDV